MMFLPTSSMLRLGTVNMTAAAGMPGITSEAKAMRTHTNTQVNIHICMSVCMC